MSTESNTRWFRLDELECGEAWIEDDRTVRWRTNRLFDVEFPFSTSVETAATMGVYVEVDPGMACESHTHDVEEVLVVHRGTLEFTVGEDVTSQVAGDVTVVPAHVAHRFLNVGDGLAGVLGLLPSRGATTTFERIVEPIGARKLGPNGPVVEERGDD